MIPADNDKAYFTSYNHLPSTQPFPQYPVMVGQYAPPWQYRYSLFVVKWVLCGDVSFSHVTCITNKSVVWLQARAWQRLMRRNELWEPIYHMKSYETARNMAYWATLSLQHGALIWAIINFVPLLCEKAKNRLFQYTSRSPNRTPSQKKDEKKDKKFNFSRFIHPYRRPLHIA